MYTRDTHFENYLETQEGKRLPVLHCIKETKGWEIKDGLYLEGCKIFDKPSFGSLELAEYVRNSKYKEIELVGLCTDICIISNALLLKAYVPESRILVDSSCCAGVTPESHENALKAMTACQVEIIGE